LSFVVFLPSCTLSHSAEVLREGDELLEVNGVPVAGRSTDEIVRLMSGEAGATLAFTIIPVHDDNIDLSFEPKYVRAHFHYAPTTDEDIPCQPLGLRFEKGDILEISNQDDPEWWQARKVFDDGAESLPGLIPARHRQQQREAMTRSYPLAKAMEDQHRKKKGLMSKLSRKKKKTVFYNQGSNQSMLSVGDEVVTYEDVVRMEPHPHWRRPIVLIGASGIGKGTLIRKLINSDHTHFAAVVQHTTRLIHPGEVDGHTYHFVTREEFELDVLQERFLEHEEVKGHLYGTSVSAIKKIIESGRVPVLDLQPQSLKRVRYSGLMPYVVFVASPRLERLVVTRRVGPERPPRRRTSSSTSYDMDSSQIYTEPELQNLLVESRLIESQYSHYFDWIIVNDDLSVASDMLKEVARRAEETQWVPASWMADHSF
jgi:MAGUK p55 subfamily protein 5